MEDLFFYARNGTFIFVLLYFADDPVNSKAWLDRFDAVPTVDLQLRSPFARVCAGQPTPSPGTQPCRRLR